MNWFSKRSNEAELKQLRQRVLELERDLARYREMPQEDQRARQENAVLRYELQKCRRDRQVLEWHHSSARRELQMTYALLKRYEGTTSPKEQVLPEAILFWLAELRAFGVVTSGLDLTALELRARQYWEASSGRSWHLDPRHLMALRATGLLAAFEQHYRTALNEDEKASDALAGLEPELVALREALAKVAGRLSVAPEGDS